MFIEYFLGMWLYAYIICLCVYVLGALVSERSVCELSDSYDTMSLGICFIVL